MDFNQFLEAALQDAALTAFLSETARDAETDEELPERYLTATPLDAATMVVGYALFRFVKDSQDNRRALAELAVAGRQLELVKQLEAEGYPREKAQAVVVALLKGIAKRSDDDPVLVKARALIGGK